MDGDFLAQGKGNKYKTFLFGALDLSLLTFSCCSKNSIHKTQPQQVENHWYKGMLFNPLPF